MAVKKSSRISKIIIVILIGIFLSSVIHYFQKNPLINAVYRNQKVTNSAFKILKDNMSDFYPLLVEELQYVDVLYEDMEGSKEGYILQSQFNKTGTNKVYLNAHFQNEPPVFSAMVIAHEVTHILQLKNAYELDCIEKEVAAFLNQAYLYFLIDDKDRNALDEAALKFEDPSSQSIRSMAIIFDSKVKECGKENWQCWSEGLKEEITKMVYSSEVYQKQCRIN